jgi:hypothetical protein
VFSACLHNVGPTTVTDVGTRLLSKSATRGDELCLATWQVVDRIVFIGQVTSAKTGWLFPKVVRLEDFLLSGVLELRFLIDRTSAAPPERRCGQRRANHSRSSEDLADAAVRTASTAVRGRARSDSAKGLLSSVLGELAAVGS